MREGAKKRLIGAVVIVALLVIFVPMLFEPESLDNLPPVQQAIPRAPAFAPAVQNEVFLGPQDSGVGGLPDGRATVSQPLALPPPGEFAPVPIGPPSGTPVGPPSGAPGRMGGAVPPARPVIPPRAAMGPADPVADKPAKAAAKGAVTPEPTPPRGANGGLPSWVNQVSSMASREAADAERDRLRAGGFTAFVEEALVNGKPTYRVLVGPELDRARTEQTAARLREKQKVNPLIKSYP